MNPFTWLATFFKRTPVQATPPGPVRPPSPGPLHQIPTAEKWKHLQVWKEGPDIIVKGTATAFGGTSDSLDNGETASGYNTKGHPHLLGVALPMNNNHVHSRAHGYVLLGSPIPAMPFGLRSNGRPNPNGAFVDVTFPNGLTVEKIPVIDLGPANWTGDAIDLTVALAQKYLPRATANNFACQITYRIRGAAKYLT